MGHYASEMMGTDPDRKTGLERAAEKKKGLQSNWDHKLELLKGYHEPFEPVDKYTCPQCFARVSYWYLQDHDNWHKKMSMQSILGPGLFG